MKNIVPIIAVILLMLGFWLMCNQTGASSSSSYEKPRPVTGEKKSLYTSSKMVVVPKTRAILDRTIEFGLAGDDYGITKQVAVGDCFLVDQGTTVLVINGGSSTSEIRIKSGPMDGQTGFVPNEFLK
jgi:hypothetical protein